VIGTLLLSKRKRKNSFTALDSYQGTQNKNKKNRDLPRTVAQATAGGRILIKLFQNKNKKEKVVLSKIQKATVPEDGNEKVFILKSKK